MSSLPPEIPDPDLEGAPRPMGNRQTSHNVRARRRIVESHLGWGMLRFGAPLAIGMALHTLFNLVDLFMVSRLPNASAALAALGLCDMVTAIATILATGISTASVALISRHVGTGHLTNVRRSTYQSLWLVFVLSVIFGVVGVFGANWIVRAMMYAKGEAADIAVPYLRVVLGGCFSIILLLQLTAIMRALGHAKTAASLLVAGNALNILLNVFFIYGPGPAPWIFAWGAPVAEALGIPRMGVIGAAWASLIGRSVPVAVGLWLLLRRRGGPRFHPIYLRPHAKELSAILKIGWPSSAQLVLRVGVILFIIALINAEFTTTGDQSALTAYSICLRVETLVLLVGMGWGAAASAFVGTNLGAGRRRRALYAGWMAALYNLVLTLGMAVLFVLFAGPIIGFFDPSPEVLLVGQEYLTIIGFSYGFIAVAIVLSQAMTGAGATLSSFVLDAIVLLGFVVPAAYVAAVTLGLPRSAVWKVIAAGNAAAAVLYTLYYVRGSFLRKAL